MSFIASVRQSQPPDAPPPPKLPPPPDHPPPPPKPPNPPPPPKPPGRNTPPRRPVIVDAAPAKIITMKPTTAAIPAMMSDPATNHAAAPTMPAPTVEPSEPPEDRAQHGADQRHYDEQDQQHRAEVEAAVARVDARGLPRRQRLAFSNDADDPVDAGFDSGAELALAKQRCHVFGDDPARRRIGQRALEPVADFDAHLLVVLRDEEQRRRCPFPCCRSATSPPRVSNRLRSARAASSARSARPAGCRCALPSRRASRREPASPAPRASA